MITIIIQERFKYASLLVWARDEALLLDDNYYNPRTVQVCKSARVERILLAASNRTSVL